MSRMRRVSRPLSLQHITCRIADRAWYVTSQIERGRYLELLGRALQHSDWKCIAYCLMYNQIQFGMIAGEQPLESWVKRVNSPFALWLNRRREQLGPVFASRPTATEIPSEKGLALIASIHNEPVRAKVVAHAADTSWSSHRAYLDVERAPRWLAVEEGLQLAGFHGASADFDAAVEVLAASDPTSLGRVRALPVPPARTTVTSDIVVRLVAEHFQLPTAALGQRYARGPASKAKQAAVHVAKALGVPLAQIASALQVTRQRASHIAMSALTDESRALVCEIVRAVRDAV